MCITDRWMHVLMKTGLMGNVYVGMNNGCLHLMNISTDVWMDRRANG